MLMRRYSLTRMAEQIRVSEQNWKALNSMKDPGDSFDDVVSRLIDEHDYMSFVGGEVDES